MKKYILFAILTFFITGCVQKTKITVQTPGQLNLKGIHKIALVEFNTMHTNKELGVFSADKKTLYLAKKMLEDVFYKEPFYKFADLTTENKIRRYAKLNDRFDGLLYGKVWWVIKDEYRNFIPSKLTLEKYRMVSYVCGHTKRGPVYCTAKIRSVSEDKPFKKMFRTKNATLMMSLTLYKLDKNGKMTKTVEIFEVADSENKLVNGKFKQINKINFDVKEKDRLTTLKTNSSFLGKISSFLGTEKKSEKVTNETKNINKLLTIPVDYQIKQSLISKIAQKLQRLISPHKKEIDVEIKKIDPKINSLFDYSANKTLQKIIIESYLAQNDPKAIGYFNDLEFYKGAEVVIKNKHKKEFEKEYNEAKKALEEEAKKAKKQPDYSKLPVFKPIPKNKLKDMAKDYIASKDNLIYNLALATEASGDFEKALEIYRFLFEELDDTSQIYADGIGRCLYALDKSDKITEETRNKIKAYKKSKL